MRVLIGARTKDRVLHYEEFGRHLGVEYKVVNCIDVMDGFPTKKVRRWIQSTRRFNGLVDSFKPDMIVTDELRHFGLAAARSNVPLIVHLAGDFWSEIKYAKETTYGKFPRNLVIGRLERMGEEILHKARIIMPISKYLDGIVRENIPDKTTHVLGRILDASAWHPEDGMSLKHPCVGLVQNATIWGKAREMLVLKNVLKRLPDVTFYWVGSGLHEHAILDELEKHPNFKWLGPLIYPDEVRNFLTEIDAYALLSGMDTYSLSVREALLMEKPSLVTNVGGIPEIIEDGKSGLLVATGDHDGIVEKIQQLLDDKKAARRMGSYGRKRVIETCSGDIARNFVKYVKAELNLK